MCIRDSMHLDLFDMAGHEVFHMRAGHFIGIAAFNDNLLHIRGIIVTDSPFDEVAFLMDQCRCAMDSMVRVRISSHCRIR